MYNRIIHLHYLQPKYPCLRLSMKSGLTQNIHNFERRFLDFGNKEY